MLQQAQFKSALHCLFAQPSTNLRPRHSHTAEVKAWVKAEGITLVFGGKQAIDGDNAQVPAMVAELLGLPCATAIATFELAGGKATVERDFEGGREVLELFRRLHDDGQTILMVTHSDEVAEGADRVITIIAHADRHLLTRGLEPSRYRHVPNGVDPNDAPDATAPLPSELSDHARWIAGGFAIGFAGSLTVANSVRPLIEAVERLSERDRPRLLLVGDGPSRRSLEPCSWAARAAIR